MTDDFSILIDPFITWNKSCDISMSDVFDKNIKAILLTNWYDYNIWDHFVISDKTWCLVIIEHELKDIWWEFKFWDYSIKIFKSGLIKIDWKNIYHAWYTVLHDDMKLLWDSEKIDLAFLPIWNNSDMWIDDSVIVASFIKSKIVVPIHYNTYDDLKIDPIEFARKIMLQSISIPKILTPWQYIILD